ncbi:MAG: nucleoside triphosphate pyrophosphohydrolase [Bacteroidales bacterium]|nr:nucleoside triphosphate pyrophosphohydrolase [Bacteroidales bacterium]
MHSKEEKLEKFGRLLDIMDKLREECPWNKAQTIDTLRPMTVEEVYELSDAVISHNEEELKKELGDVLLHIVFYARIAQEQGRYDIGDVLDKICDKLVFRHPHVFSDVKASDAKTVSENWEMMKTKEKGGNKRVLSGVPDSMPSVLKAFAMQDKARGVGFDWEDKTQVWDKVREELSEYQAELDAMDAAPGHADKSVCTPSEDSSPEFRAAYDRAEEELGDFMFATINAARLYGLNPDTALSRACEKFRRRFTYLEEQTIRKGLSLHDMTLAQMDEIWDEGKALGL